MAVLSGDLANLKTGNLGFRLQMQSRAMSLQAGLGDAYTEMQSRRNNLPEGERLTAQHANKLDSIMTEQTVEQMNNQAALFDSLKGAMLSPIKGLREAQKNAEKGTNQEGVSGAAYNRLSEDINKKLTEKMGGKDITDLSGFETMGAMRSTLTELMEDNKKEGAKLQSQLQELNNTGKQDSQEAKDLNQKIAENKIRDTALLASLEGITGEDANTKLMDSINKNGFLQLETSYKILQANVDQINKLEEAIRQKEISSFAGGSGMVGKPSEERKYEREYFNNLRRAGSSNPNVAYAGSAALLKFGVENQMFGSVEEARANPNYGRSIAGRVRAMQRLGLGKSTTELTRIARMQVEKETGISDMITMRDVEASKKTSEKTIDKMNISDEQKKALKAQVNAGQSLTATTEAVSKGITLATEQENTEAVKANSAALGRLLTKLEGGKPLEQILAEHLAIVNDKESGLKKQIEIKLEHIQNDPVVANLANKIKALEDQINKEKGEKTKAPTVPPGPGQNPPNPPCWVAREIYGTTNVNWRIFRSWLFSDSPKWFRNIYINYGEKFSIWLSKNKWIKPPIKFLMDFIIKKYLKSFN